MIDCRPPSKRAPDDGAIGQFAVKAPPVPRVFQRALAVPALANPRATIDGISPLKFEQGSRIDLEVCYTPANDEESAWQTVVNVIKDGEKLVQERQYHNSMAPGLVCADCDTGINMLSTPVNLTIEVWGHPDYLETSWPDP